MALFFLLFRPYLGVVVDNSAAVCNASKHCEPMINKSHHKARLSKVYFGVLKGLQMNS